MSVLLRSEFGTLHDVLQNEHVEFGAFSVFFSRHRALNSATRSGVFRTLRHLLRLSVELSELNASDEGVPFRRSESEDTGVRRAAVPHVDRAVRILAYFHARSVRPADAALRPRVLHIILLSRTVLP